MDDVDAHRSSKSGIVAKVGERDKTETCLDLSYHANRSGHTGFLKEKSELSEFGCWGERGKGHSLDCCWGSRK